MPPPPSKSGSPARPAPAGRGIRIATEYQRLDGENQPCGGELAVGDRVLVTLELGARGGPLRGGGCPVAGHSGTGARGLRRRRGAVLAVELSRIPQRTGALFFADALHAGNYKLSYYARVRAAGQVNALSGTVQEMYRPRRFGLTGTHTLEENEKARRTSPWQMIKRLLLRGLGVTILLMLMVHRSSSPFRALAASLVAPPPPQAVGLLAKRRTSSIDPDRDQPSNNWRPFRRNTAGAGQRHAGGGGQPVLETSRRGLAGGRARHLADEFGTGASSPAPPPSRSN